ncbi:serine hydrolase domain-containing protein [Cytobacillus sp. FJAT-54145]|uniref:Serine hydrolase domain-containing protein n=1 Tax=Cytobacillus spartinae TaxID=3299023 RepID=A0ABW6K987_9BACI
MNDSKKQKLEEYVVNVMNENHIPGAAIAISQNGKLFFQKGFGYRDIEKKELVTPDTIFGVASVTKSFTAMAILMLEQEGKLSVQDPVIKYLPEFTLKNVSDIKQIKIHHLLSHTTGLPPMNRREDLNKLNDHLNYLAEEDVEMLGLPGEYFSYCNDTFLLLGLIIERLTGILYRRYITEQILNPGKMYRSTFSLEEVAKYDNVSVPYVYNKKTGRYEKQDWPTLGNYEVGGGIRSNVLDLLKYGQLFIGDLARISKSLLEKMWEPVYQTSDNTFYGYALSVTPNYSGVTLVEHSGGQPGVSSNFGFIPEENIVVSVLTNVSGAPSSDIWLAAVNAALNLPLDQKRVEEPAYQNAHEDFTRFKGDYYSAEGYSVSIVEKEGELQALIDEELIGLKQTGPETFSSHTGQKLRFYFEQQEQAWAVLFGSRMLRRR